MNEPINDDGLAAFTDYFVRNYPGPDTIIGDPRWHAPKIFRAAQYAIRAARKAQVDADAFGAAWTSRRESVIAYMSVELETSKHFTGNSANALAISARIYDNLAVALAPDAPGPVTGAVGEPAVKALEWSESCRDATGYTLSAPSAVGTYEVLVVGRSVSWTRPGTGYEKATSTTNAQAAAQADYDARIRSALASPQPDAGRDAGLEEARSAANNVRVNPPDRWHAESKAIPRDVLDDAWNAGAKACMDAIRALKSKPSEE